jgi:hypothetical protein
VLRLVTGTVGVALLVGAMVLFVAHGPVGAIASSGVIGVLLVAGGLFERRRYRARVDRENRRWQDTAERFVDPTTGRLMEVRYDPETGERDYVEVDRSP